MQKNLFKPEFRPNILKQIIYCQINYTKFNNPTKCQKIRNFRIYWLLLWNKLAPLKDKYLNKVGYVMIKRRIEKLARNKAVWHYRIPEECLKHRLLIKRYNFTFKIMNKVVSRGWKDTRTLGMIKNNTDK